ncbi:hypothetical protein [Thiorhodovibrio frisius]|nr:hypothetical protein [Thiorhodovibrio frisius]
MLPILQHRARGLDRALACLGKRWRQCQAAEQKWLQMRAQRIQ